MSIYSKTIDIQKLMNAWDRVRKNKPAAGVDDVTYDSFDACAKEEIKTLNRELADHTYRSLPVKLVNLYKGEKVRTIALYSMRDKVVQQSLAAELTAIFDPMFSTQTYAYRNDKSAISAVEEIGKEIEADNYRVFLKADITGFFDAIQWEILKKKLAEVICEEDVLDLIRECTCSSSLDERSGEIVAKEVGLFQGSALAPVLSNIYMMEFDRWLSSIENAFFVRYSDDLVVLCSDRDTAIAILQEIRNRFDALGLSLNDRKSDIGELSESFDFLGYHFDDRGKSIPAKAETNLYDRLEMMWLTSGDIGVEDKLKKVLEIVGGWEQYFRGDREIGSVFEFAAIVYTKGGNDSDREMILEKRKLVRNIYKDLAEYLANTWRKNKLWQDELNEYEEFWNVPKREPDAEIPDEQYKLMHELLKAYRQFIIRESYDIAVEIMQSYTDLKLYTQAEYWHERAEALQVAKDKTFDAMVSIERSDNDIVFKSGTASKMSGVFVGREDLHAREELDGERNRKISPDMRPLTEQTLKDHLLGKVTVDTYVQRPNATVHFLVIDVDISRHILIQHDRNSDEFRTYLQRALDVAQEVCRLLRQMGLTGYIEYSGNRGYHVWLFFAEWIQTRYANMLSDIIEKKLEKENDISVEFFPNKTRLKAGKFGQVLKVPYGIHGKTGERSYFLDEAGTPILEVDRAVDSFARASLADVKKVIAVNTETEERSEHVEVDSDISPFGDIPDAVSEVLMNCNLMRYLCLKSVKTGYLGHFERLMILYVFGHLGPEGQEFVHKVMSFTLNYKHHVTESFIRKMPEKPISCVKLRENFKQLTAEFGCSCTFKRNRNCYPSPVLHAISLSDDIQSDITLPATRTLTKEKETMVKAEINVRSKAQEVANKLLDVKKQRRGLDKIITKYEKELGDIFDAQGIDELEIEIGVLRRRKNGDSIEWFIEI